MEIEMINQKLGKRVRELRQENGLTQQELADRTELTKGFISQLERGQVSPSVVTLLDIIECLGTTPSAFFSDTHQEKVVFHPEDFFEKTEENGTSIQWIVPTAQGNQMEPLLVVVPPHQTLEDDRPHPGEEFGYLISGRLSLHLDDAKYEIKAGDSFYYRTDCTHQIENTGSKPAKFIWVSTPPTF